MTAQDWYPGVDDEEAQVGAPRRRRWVLLGVGALAVVLALAALLVVVVVDRAGAPGPGTPAPVAAASSSPPAGSQAAAPPEGPVVIQAALRDPRLAGDLGQPGPLIVGTQPLQGGGAPDRVPNFDTCGANTATLQYLPVQIRKPPLGLSATLTIQTTASTPPGIGRLGFFFQAGDASTPCPHGAWSTADTFMASNVGQETITGYVVLDQAITSSAPQGRADVFRTLRLWVSDIRYGGLAIVGPPTAGSLCYGTQNQLCAALR